MEFREEAQDDQNEDPNQASLLDYHQEYVSRHKFNLEDTLSDELQDDEHNSSYRTDDSQLSYDEIEKEFEYQQENSTQEEKFDNPSLDLEIDPQQIISDRTDADQFNNQYILEKYNLMTPSNDVTALTAQTSYIRKSKKNISNK